MNPTIQRNIETRWTAAMQTEGHSRHTIRRRIGTLHRIQKDLRKPVIDLGIDEITGWLQRFPGGGTRAAYFGDLEAFYLWADLAGLTGGDFKAPTDRIRRPRQPKRLPRPITTEQLFAGLDGATGDLRDWILLGAYQACRVSDTAAVRGEHISTPWMRFPDGKGHSDKTIPLHGELAETVARRPRRGFWFPGTGASGHITAHHIAEKVCAHFDAIVPDFTYHRLRHWCATEMLRAGASLPEVQQFMRHEVITSTVLYTQVLQDATAAAAARLPRRTARPLASAS